VSIRKKVFLSAAAIALPLALISVGSSTAFAGGSKFSGNAPGTLNCSGVSGTVKFKPPLTLTTGGEAVSAKGILSNCHASNPAVSITDGKFKATITSTSSTHGCAGLAGGTSSETFTVKWKGDYNGSKAKFTSSTIVIDGSTIVTNGAGDEGFELPNPSTPHTTTSGSFAGSSSSESYAYTTETAGAFSAACGSGIKSVTIGSGTINNI